MSRIGKKPIEIPDGVEVALAPGQVTVKGPKGQLVQPVSTDMKVEQENGTVTVARPPVRPSL